MPRLANALLLQARRLHPCLPLLLRTCRDIDSAQNELRWLREYVQVIYRNTRVEAVQKHGYRGYFPALTAKKQMLNHICAQRGRGMPLQYILGTEYFGDLELFCQPGVLIPRQDTADLVTMLASRICDSNMVQDSCLRILDLCSGSGCISLLMRYLLTQKRDNPHLQLDIMGVDISPPALLLARKNLQRCFPVPTNHTVGFMQADILMARGSSQTGREKGDEQLIPSLQKLLTSCKQPRWDVVISNPPYVSRKTYFSSRTARSVRNFEPRLALVPPLDITNPATEGIEDGDLFYPAILDHAVSVNAKIVLVEIGSLEQALRVATRALRQRVWTAGVELWEGGSNGTIRTFRMVIQQGQAVVSKGNADEGRVYAVFASRVTP